MADRARLHAEDLDALAEMVADGLAARMLPLQNLVDAAEMARRLGVSPSYVRRHARELGGVRIGSRWRFLPGKVVQRLTAEAIAPVAQADPGSHGLAAVVPIRGGRDA